jgi:glycosyltransferase involved in cell wall biosynthesis
MRVLHLIDSLHWGGAEKWIASFTEMACHRGVEAAVVSLQPFIANNPYRAQIESFGATAMALSITRIYDPKAIPTLVRIFRKGGFDLIQTHLSHSNILGVLSARAAGVPVVATLHSTHLDTRGHYRSRSWVEQIVLRYAAQRVLAVGNGVAEAHRARLAGRDIDTVPNAVKPGVVLSASERNRLRVEMAGDPDRILIIAVGRLVLLKGYAELITAFSEVRKDYPNAFLVIVGDGRLRGELESLVSALEEADNVRFLGVRTDVPRLLAASDIFVNASHWEGLSMSMLEAMAAGLPILATSVGDAPVLLANGRGMLIAPRDVNALKAGLGAMLGNSSRKSLGDAAKAFAESMYALDPWFDKILDIYSKARQGQSRQPQMGIV